MRRPLILAALAGLGTADAPAVHGQTPYGCTYDRCAIRVEQQRVVRGVPGAETDIGRLGVWGAPRLTALVEQSDSARHYAALFERQYRTGVRMSLLGAAAGGTLLALGWQASTERDRQRLTVAAIPFLALGVYGDFRRSAGQRALSRAIWWYNRDLPRAGEGR